MAKFISALLSFSMLTQAASPALADLADSRFIFRHKQTFSVSEQPGTEEKDVVAYFIGGVGFEFAETLPLKPEWQDDSWSIVSGTLPDGIEFDEATRTFKGTPTTASTDTVVFLRGVDANGTEVADARVSFDIRGIMGVPVKVDLYAHTGKYKVDELAIPAGITVDHWERVNVGPLPPGINANGPYFEGTPKTAGQWRLLLVGMDYEGRAVVTYYGKYTVEDRPTFDKIPNDIRKLPQLEGGFGMLVSFGAPSTHQVLRAIDPTKPVKYIVEQQDPKLGLPGSVKIGGKQPATTVSGQIREPYDTAVIRYRAIDSDGVEGFSNWFEFGTSDPQPKCNPYHNAATPIYLRTGKANSVNIPRPWGDQGIPAFSVVEGSLPKGIVLTPSTGILEGTPTVSGEKNAFKVKIDVVNGENTVSTTCSFNTEVRAAATTVRDITDAQAKHVRVGKTYAGAISIGGGIPKYTLSFSDPSLYPGIAFTSANVDMPEVKLGGLINAPGNHVFDVTLKNGDGSEKTGSATAVGYGPLKIGTMETVTIKRLEASQDWALVPFDATTVIPDASGATDFPQFSLENPKSLPYGITLGVNGNVTGGTSDKAGTYGPFKATISDYTGDTDTGNQFQVVVEDREPISVEPPPTLAIRVENDLPQELPPPVVVQPPLAKNFAVSFKLQGAELPNWLSFDTTTGVFRADANIPFTDKRPYGPFTITATDSDGSTDTTATFDVEAVDWEPPFAFPKPLVRGTVSGNTALKEAPTTIFVDKLRELVDDKTVIGGRSGVTFGPIEPASPAGLSWDPVKGELAGRPTSEFDGLVTIPFFDKKLRRGEIVFPMKVQAYPTVFMDAAEYSVPRLADAKTADKPAVAKQGAGFWTTPKWSLDPTGGKLPSGLYVEETTGAIAGQSDAPVDTTATGIVIVATSAGPLGEVLESRTAPFTVRITAPSKITLSYTTDPLVFRLDEIDPVLSLYKVYQRSVGSAKVAGSHVKPLTFTLDMTQAKAEGMSGDLAINPTTGAILGNTDRPGDWTVFVNVTDAEGRTLATPLPLKVKSTLTNSIKRESGGGSFMLRTDEPFASPAIKFSNSVGKPVFSFSPATVTPSATLGFDVTTGEFSDLGFFPDPLSAYKLTVNATDAHGRTFGSDPAHYEFKVKGPLKLSSTSTSQTTARQFDPSNPVDVVFSPTVTNAIGDIVYTLGGDVPGTLVTRFYDKSGTSWYDWTQSSETHLLMLDALGAPVEYTVAGKTKPILTTTVGGSQANAPAGDYFPPDALVFDSKVPSLKGVPSRSGSFSLTLSAADTHANDYVRDVASRISANKAESDSMTLVVDKAADLLASNSASSETLALYGDKPTMKHSVTGAAYGLPVTWTRDGNQPPPGITDVHGSQSLTYTGYPSVMGTFKDISWRAIDAAGRQASTTAVSMTVGPQAPFTVSSSATSEIVPRWTKQPSTSHSASGGSLGGAVTWSLLSGTLPPGITPSPSAKTMSYVGYPDTTGTWSNIVWRATDARGRTADTQPLSITVGPRLALALEADVAPPTYVVNTEIAANSVRAKNVALGLTVPKSDWSVLATTGLPKGISAVIEDGRVVFSGTPEETGDRTVVVSAIDTRGGSASLSLPFKIIPTNDEIALGVSEITTKAGYPYRMQPTYGNTYGKVRFYSNDITAGLAKHVNLDGTTGLVSGQFDTSGNRSFNLTVTDDTNRLTTKTVVVNVIPNVRVTVPQLVIGTQSTPLDRTVATDYSLGSATYTKGSGTWPIGIEVDALTGSLVSKYTNPNDGTSTTEVVAAAGDYPGLSIDVVDTFTIDGITYTDRQTSNAFTIRIEPSTLKPDISNPSKTILGTQGTAINDWFPTVVDTSKKRPWNLGGTVYESSHDLSAYGLVFDTSSGKISGVPTQPFIIRDFTVKVTSQRGDSDITTPFWIGVAPKDAMAINSKQKLDYKFRLNKAFATDPVVVDNAVGTLKFSKPGTSLNWDTATGVWSYGASGQSSSWANNRNEYKSVVTDEFNRTLSWSFFADFAAALKVTPLVVKFVPGAAFTTAAPKIDGLIGQASVTGNLPAGVKVSDPVTGVMQGTISSSASSSLTGTITVTDTDGTTADGTVTFTGDTVSITDVTANRLVFSTEGQAGTFTPTVKQSDGKAWSYGGLTFKVNHDLNAYGVSLDKNTGVISGTPTAPVIIRDLVLTVTTNGGQTASTAPFFFGIVPKAALAISPTQKKDYRVRALADYITDAVVVLNYVGNIKFSKVTTTLQNFDENTGQYSSIGNQSATWGNTSANHTVRATDEFGRTVNFTYSIAWGPAFSVTDTSTFAVPGLAFSAAAPTVVGKKGNLAFTVKSGPSYLSVNATNGSGSGTAPANVSLPAVATVQVTDDWDGWKDEFTVTLYKGAPGLFWRAQSTSGGATKFWEIVPKTADGSMPIEVTGMTAAFDGNLNTASSGAGYVTYRFEHPVELKALEITTSVSNGGTCNGSKTIPVQTSADGVNWTSNGDWPYVIPNGCSGVKYTATASKP